MRKTLLIALLLFGSKLVLAQSSYAEIQKQVKSAFQSYSAQHPNYPVLKKLITAFEQAKRLDSAFLKKDNVGIAIFLSDQNPELDIFPARYTYSDDRINLSALRNKDTKKPSIEMREYVKTYLADFENLNKTTIFKKLIFNKPPTAGTFTSNQKEQIVEEPYSTTFIRGDDDWMYGMSIGNQGIILYVFKMTMSGGNLIDKS